ncbi:MAG: class I SAM-dependent methyltransferase [Phycisphaerales bacterium]|nr:class I SAM-dependent methyltransferase [Phycisphaerales bacterium]
MAMDPNVDPRLHFEIVTRCLCGGELRDGPIWGWGICPTCGTWVNTKRPTRESLHIVYGETYWTTTQELAGCPPLEQRFEADAKDRVPSFIKALEPFLKEPSTICELGCGNARLLHELKTRGHDVVGTEFDIGVIERMRRLTDVKLIQGDSDLFDDASFDAMISIDVLEHTHDPVAFLREHVRLLRQGGILLLKAPVHDDPAEPYKYTVGMMWKLYHLYLFSRRMIEDVIVSAGFEIVTSDPKVLGHRFYILRKRETAASETHQQDE